MSADTSPIAAVGWATDLERVTAILAGDTKAWHAFVEEYSDRVLAAALAWCRPNCSRSCPLCRRKSGLLEMFLRQDCDEVSEAYIFILEKIRQVSLPRYQGRCALETFLFPLLNRVPETPRRKSTGSSSGARYGYPQLFAEFVRQKYGRIRPPAAVQNLGVLAGRVFVQICYGRDDGEIALALRLTAQEAAQLPQIRAQIDEALHSEGWRSYWQNLGHRQIDEVSASTLGVDPESGEDVFDPEDAPGVEDTGGDAIAGIDRETLWEAVDRLPPEQRALLRLHFVCGWSARQIGESVQMEQRKVFTEIERALKSLR